VIDLIDFIESIKKIQPWLIRNYKNRIPEKEFIVYPDENYHKVEKLNNCILCGICNSECEVFKIDKHFIGPAAVIKSSRFIYDARDGLGPTRISQLIELGLHLCNKVEECKVKCPKDVPLCKEVLNDVMKKF
jgi:succinate dehydrogenase / fumarate reductase iron-sulfur subunit